MIQMKRFIGIILNFILIMVFSLATLTAASAEAYGKPVPVPGDFDFDPVTGSVSCRDENIGDFSVVYDRQRLTDYINNKII